MNAQSVVIDRVFDVLHQYWGRGGPKCTSLGLVVSGERHFFVRLHGWQEVQSNTVVTALFRKPGDWSDLVGWVDHADGQVTEAFLPASAFAAVTIWLLVIGWLAFLLSTPWLLEAPLAVQVGVIIGTAVLAIVATHAAWRARRTKTEQTALNACRAELVLAPNPSIERTSSGKLRLPPAAAHVER